MLKATVSGMMPNSLNWIQNSVVCVLQITSLRNASTKKNMIHRLVSNRQPWSCKFITEPNNILSNCTRVTRPPLRIAANKRLTMVGLSLMNVSSCSINVRPPNASRNKPETNGMTGKRLSSSHIDGTATAVTTMNAAVAVKIP